LTSVITTLWRTDSSTVCRYFGLDELSSCHKYPTRHSAPSQEISEILVDDPDQERFPERQQLRSSSSAYTLTLLTLPHYLVYSYEANSPVLLASLTYTSSSFQAHANTSNARLGLNPAAETSTHEISNARFLIRQRRCRTGSLRHTIHLPMLFLDNVAEFFESPPMLQLLIFSELHYN